VARPACSRARPYSAGDGEYKAAFSAYVKRGEEKALQVGVGADGGYVVPPEVETEITRLMTQISPDPRHCRRAAGVERRCTSARSRVSGPQTGWVGETASAPDHDQPDAGGAELSDDRTLCHAGGDDGLSRRRGGGCRRLDRRRGERGVCGAGDDGLRERRWHQQADRLSRVPTMVAESSWSWGSLGYVPTGTSGALPASNPSGRADRPRLRAQGRLSAERELGDEPQDAGRAAQAQGFADGNYLWQPAASAGRAGQFAGLSAGRGGGHAGHRRQFSLSIAFGDFRRGYLDRRSPGGERACAIPFSAKPYVLFYTTKRVGGGVADYDAIKLLKFGTS
jgi:predicted phage gp36 major capsid-like protein